MLPFSFDREEENLKLGHYLGRGKGPSCQLKGPLSPMVEKAEALVHVNGRV